MRVRVRARHASATSHGQGAAPDTPSRSRRPPLKPGTSSSRWNIVATPGMTLTGSRAMISATRSGTKRSTSRTVVPAISGASSAPLRPKAWASGSAASSTSSSARPITGPAHMRSANSSAAWERTAPFGRPVLPEV